MTREVPWPANRTLPPPEKIEGRFRLIWLKEAMRGIHWDQYLLETSEYRLQLFMLTPRYRAMRKAFMKGRYTLESFTRYVWAEAFDEGTSTLDWLMEIHNG